MAGVLGLVAVVPVIGAFKIHSHQETLHRRGMIAEGTVVGKKARGDTDYLIVALDACRCRAAVATSRTEAHPVGSTLAIRYDPLRRVQAEALVDRPNPYDSLIVLGVGLGVTAVVVVPILLVQRRRRRRLRSLAATSAPTQVRIELWRRAFLHTTVPYLSAYPAGNSPESAPLFAVALTEEDSRKLEDDEGGAVDLFGPVAPGGRVALRAGDDTIMAPSRTKSPEWEARHRAVLPPATLGDEGAPLITDPREARAYLRIQRQLVMVVAATIAASLVRLVPDRLLSLGLVLLALLIAGASIVFWRYRRLLTRAAARLPGPTPEGRRGRRAARELAARRLRSPGGDAALAELLGTTPEALQADRKRSARWLWGSIALTGAGLAAFVVWFALS